MASLQPFETESNPHICTLQALLGGKYSAIDWLVVSHDDVRMVQALSTALAGKQAVMLRVPQENWDFEQMTELFQWALDRYPIRNLVIAGCAQAKLLRSTPEQPLELSSTIDCVDGYDRLVAGVMRYRHSLREAQCGFADWVERLLRDEEINGRVVTGALALHPLLYRADGGLFMAYDVDGGSFSPVLSSPSVDKAPSAGNDGAAARA